MALDGARSGRRPASLQNCWNPASCVLRLTCGFDVLEVLSETVAFVPIASRDVLAEAHLTSVVSTSAHGLELLVFDFSASDSGTADTNDCRAGSLSATPIKTLIRRTRAGEQYLRSKKECGNWNVPATGRLTALPVVVLSCLAAGPLRTCSVPPRRE